MSAIPPATISMPCGSVKRLQGSVLFGARKPERKRGSRRTRRTSPNSRTSARRFSSGLRSSEGSSGIRLLLGGLLLAGRLEVLRGEAAVLLLHEQLDLLLRLLEDGVALAQRLDPGLVLLDRLLEAELAAFQRLDGLLDLPQLDFEGLFLDGLVVHGVSVLSTLEMTRPLPSRVTMRSPCFARSASLRISWVASSRVIE